MTGRGSNWGISNWNSRGFGARGGRGGGGTWRGARRNFRGPPSHGNFGGYRGSRPHNNYGGSNKNWNNRPKRDTPGKRLSEEEIGVTEYITEHKGFQGIIKSRYSDFQVSEINEQGEVAKLTDTNPPAAPADDTVDEDEDLLLSKYNLEILPMDTWDRINKLAVSEASTEKVEVDVTGVSKEQRTKIHNAVKKAFGDSIIGSTVNDSEKKLVRFERYRKGVRIDNRVKWVWPGEYLYFVVHKENCDTMDAAARLTERLRLNIKPSMLGYAGTKDRRAKTSQWFSLRKVDPRKVAAAVRGLRDIFVGNYSFSDSNLRLGMLKGNKFRIALRNVTASDEDAFAACALLQQRGFINYYGLQRFGTRADSPTYRIGLSLLRGDFKEAIASILEERDGPASAALKAYATSGAEAALRAWPRSAPRSAIEHRLIKALAQTPTDLHGALNKLARNTRLLYLHSYQSLVWNRAVSERIRRLGLAPAPGDLVPLADVQQEVELREEDSDSEETETDTDTQDGDVKQDGGETEDKMADEKPQTDVKPLNNSLETSIKEKQKVAVKVLTQEDVDSGKYSMFDVVLPLPGYMIEYPSNMKDFYEELLTKDGLTLDLKHKFKSYSMSGAYRHVVARVSHASWRCVRYSEPHADLLLSDRDELEGRALSGVLPDGKYKALLLTMTLPASCYATMALRELLKADTSGDHQASQNDYHKQKEEVNIKSEETRSKGEECQNESEENVNISKETEETSSEVKAEVNSQGEKRKLESDGEGNTKRIKEEVAE